MENKEAIRKFEKTNKKFAVFRNAFYLFVMLSLIVLLVMSYISNQNLNEQNETIKHQTDINQRFLKCLILVPQTAERTIKQRTELVDKCIVDSKSEPIGKI